MSKDPIDVVILKPWSFINNQYIRATLADNCMISRVKVHLLKLGYCFISERQIVML